MRRIAHGLGLESCKRMAAARHFVYIIKSITTPDEYYVDVTSNVDLRLRAHNEGLSRHTSQHGPWRTLVVLEFDEEKTRAEVRALLEVGIGPRIRAARHFRQTVPFAKRPLSGV